MSDVVQLLIILLPLVPAIAVDECAEDKNFGYSISFATGLPWLLDPQPPALSTMKPVTKQFHNWCARGDLNPHVLTNTGT